MTEELLVRGYDYAGGRKVSIAVTPDGKLLTDSSGGGGTALDQAGVQAAIQAATNLDGVEPGLTAILNKLSSDPATQTTLASVLTTLGSILTQLQTDLATLKTNTGRISPYEFQLAQDSNGTVFIVRYDKQTGTVENLNVATLAPFVPVGSVQMTDPIAADLAIELNEFEALTTSAGNWTAGEYLTRVQVVVPTTGVVSSTVWQSPSGATLATAPVVGTDVEDADRQALNQLRAILNRLPTALVGGRLSVLAKPTTATGRVTGLVSTSSTGTQYAALDSAACTQVEIFNDSLRDLEMLATGDTQSVPIPSGRSKLVQAITNADQVSIRRVDQSNTVISVKWEAYTL